LVDLDKEFHETDNEGHSELMEVFWMTAKVMNSIKRNCHLWLESEMQHERTQNSNCKHQEWVVLNLLRFIIDERSQELSVQHNGHHGHLDEENE